MDFIENICWFLLKKFGYRGTQLYHMMTQPCLSMSLHENRQTRLRPFWTQPCLLALSQEKQIDTAVFVFDTAVPDHVFREKQTDIAVSIFDTAVSVFDTAVSVC